MNSSNINFYLFSSLNYKKNYTGRIIGSYYSGDHFPEVSASSTFREEEFVDDERRMAKDGDRQRTVWHAESSIALLGLTSIINMGKEKKSTYRTERSTIKLLFTLLVRITIVNYLQNS